MNTNSLIQRLAEIETHIGEIDRSLDILDPANSIESQQIENKILILKSYIAELEKDGQRSHLILVS